jgi:dTDP-4-amino-4,6-dideoxygalactose transaminase
MELYPSTPFLSIKNLFKTFFIKKVDDEILASPWLNNESSAPFWFSKSSCALLVIAKWYELFYKKSPKIWVPDYFCNTSLQFLIDNGFEIIFYDITHDLNPDWESISNELQFNKPDIFLIVHYFGIPADCKKASSFCRKNDSILVEDCAHFLIPKKGIGEFGDFIFFSPHKLLAIPDGSLLVMRINKSKDNKEKTIMMNIIEEIEQRSMKTSLWVFKSLIKKIIPKIFFINKNNKSKEYILPISFYPKQSEMSKKLLSIEIDRLNYYEQIRIKNFEYFHNVCQKNHYCEKVTSPYMLIFKGLDKKNTKDLHSNLKKIGFPISPWPGIDIPKEVLKKQKYKENVAIELNQTLLFLPIHQDLKEKNILLLLKNINIKFLKNNV